MESKSVPKKKCNIIQTVSKVTRRLENGDYKCIVVDGCPYTQHNFIAGNFKRHIQRLHPAEFVYLNLGNIETNTTPEKKERLIPVRMTTQRLVGIAVKLVTKHALPFNAISWEAIRELIEGYAEPLHITINSTNIVKYVNKVASSMNELIRSDAEGLISIKTDIATKMHRSLMGINYQKIMADGTFIKRTLGKCNKLFL